jgi:type IV pilus assembly protein PilQ
VRQPQKLSGIGIGATVVALSVQPVWAASNAVTAVRLNPTSNSLEVILEAQAETRPEIFTVSRGNELVADLKNTQLRLSKDESFVQENPMPGINSVAVRQVDANSIRVIVSGATSAPKGEIVQAEGKQITLSFSPNSKTQAATGEIAPSPASTPSGVQTLAQTPPTPTPIAPPVVQPTPPLPTPNIVVPNPEIRIQGNPAPAQGAVQPILPAPPFLPRAVAPPVGDISVSNINGSGDGVDLGTTVRVPRLVLKDAPVREVLELLARSAGLNLAFIGGTTSATTAPATPGASQAATTISLNLENEPVQNVFNYVVQFAGLQASRVGRTIFVGSQLPQGVRNLVVRTVRLNQVTAGQAVGFLVSQGAEQQQVTSTTTLTSVTDTAAGSSSIITTTAPPLIRNINTTNTITRVAPPDVQTQGTGTSGPAAPLVLRGMLVAVDERLNAVTLTGEPRKVEIASALLTQLDLRRRQVAVNVKIVDVNLTRENNFNTSFSFGVGNSSFGVNSGSTGLAFNYGGGLATPISSSFILNLAAAIRSSNAKILTDPTLVVQEGERAIVNLSQEVFAGLQTTYTAVGNTTQPVQTPIIKNAGLIMDIQVTRIDDNGFVTLSITPTVSSVGNKVTINGQGDVSLLQQRQAQSGQIRLRDGQTLILSGVIQEVDDVAVNKVPILGDIPLIGALFRTTSRTNQRQEIIVLVTPQIIDDSARATFGYNYTPGSEVRQILQRQDGSTPSGNR